MSIKFMEVWRAVVCWLFFCRLTGFLSGHFEGIFCLYLWRHLSQCQGVSKKSIKHWLSEILGIGKERGQGKEKEKWGEGKKMEKINQGRIIPYCELSSSLSLRYMYWGWSNLTARRALAVRKFRTVIQAWFDAGSWSTEIACCLNTFATSFRGSYSAFSLFDILFSFPTLYFNFIFPPFGFVCRWLWKTTSPPTPSLPSNTSSFVVHTVKITLIRLNKPASQLFN